MIVVIFYVNVIQNYVHVLCDCLFVVICKFANELLINALAVEGQTKRKI